MNIEKKSKCKETSEMRPLLMNVRVHLLTTSQAIKLEALNTYTKDGMFCVYTTDEVVRKYPVSNIFEIQEDYKVS